MLDMPADRTALAAAQLDAVAAAYGRASDLIRPLLRDIPDGHVAVGALDGVTAVVPAPATLANGNAPVTTTEAATAAFGAVPGRG